jgi:hypothetical protein
MSSAAGFPAKPLTEGQAGRQAHMNVLRTSVSRLSKSSERDIFISSVNCCLSQSAMGQASLRQRGDEFAV